MDPRASFLIETLGLVAHPEGGFYREIFRSSSLVTARSIGANRSAITSIYHLLPAGQISKFHCVRSDEVWHFLEGAPLELFELNPDLTRMETHVIGPVSENARPIHTVRADYWQAAKPKGTYTLAGCTVGPGFEFEDFRFLSAHPDQARIVRQMYPAVASLF
jgi:uncharacterized protein